MFRRWQRGAAEDGTKPTTRKAVYMSLPHFATRYPVTVAMGTLAVVLLGVISMGRLGTDLLPRLETPVITVDLQAHGRSPQEMEERYTRGLEREVSTLTGVRRVYSVTRPGQSVVVVEFHWNTDMEFALLDVQRRAGQYAVDDAITVLDVRQQDPQALPVMRLAVEHRGIDDLDGLLGTIETALKPKLEALPGIAAAEIEGGARKEVKVFLQDHQVEAFGVTPEQVIQRIQAANADVSGGTVRDGGQSYQVKGLGRLHTMDDLRDLIVAERRQTADGRDTVATRVPVFVRDIARVELEYEERETVVRLNGSECVGLAIYKEGDANTVDVVRTVQRAMADLAADLPELRLTVVENQARFIEDAIGEVEAAAVYGALLAVIVLFLFLRHIMVTLVIAVAIPISILATFTLMFFQGLTLNIMTLGGLALGAGMLVDNAIVVIENIYRRLELGADARTASAEGTSEVGVAILAATLTTVSVFLPVVYMHGVTGALFREQAWTVTFSLLASLAVAMTTVPMLTSRLLRARSAAPVKDRWPRYRALLEWTLNHRGSLFMVVAVILAVTAMAARRMHTEFIPKESRGLVHIDLTLPDGARLEVMDQVGSRAGRIIMDLGAGRVTGVYARAGRDPARTTQAGQATGPNHATLSVMLRPGTATGALLEAVEAQLAEIPGLTAQYRLHDTAFEGLAGNRDAPIAVQVVGDDLDLLQSLTARLRQQLDELPAVYNVSTNFQGGQPEIDLNLDPEVAAAFGLTPQVLMRAIERRLAGEVAGELSRDQRSRLIRVGYEPVDLRALRLIRLDSADGAHLTLGDVADPRLVEGPREILRQDQRRIGQVSGYLVDGAVLQEAVRQVRHVLAAMELPPGYRVVLSGEEQERAESFGSLQFALILSVLLVYMVMASLFESLLHPFTVIFSVPLAGVGVVLALFVASEPLSVMAFLGIIMLGGIAVNDAIILVDRINQLRPASGDVRAAVLQAAQDRLRPILMTSATTVLALLPMALGTGQGARLRAPMAVAVIGGLVTATLMTLLVIPTLYELIERLRRRRAS